MSAPTTHAAEAPPKGALVIIGGNLRPETAEVWKRVVQLAGGPGARIAVFPSASATPERSGDTIMGILNQHGADAFMVPLAVRLEGSDFRQVAEDGKLAAAVRAAGGVFFAGGDQARITQALVREDGSRSALLDAVWDVYRRGGVVAGTSAGAAIMSSTMFYAPRTVFGVMVSGVQEGREIAPGLGFIGDDIFIDQHLLVRGRFARMIPAMLAKGYKLGLGIDEDTAMVIDSKRRLEIVGATGALLIDLRRASTDAAGSGFNVSHALISYLDHGDRYDLAAHQFVAPGAKLRARPPALGTEVPQHIFSADILGANALVKLMDSLVKNQRPQAYGVAISGPGEPPPRMAFQFTVSKTAESVSYALPDGSRPSILNLRLDIRPLDLGHMSAPK